jgi:hypothetical protein
MKALKPTELASTSASISFNGPRDVDRAKEYRELEDFKAFKQHVLEGKLPKPITNVLN